MARGRPRLKCDNCYYSIHPRVVQCVYRVPGGPCERCLAQGIVCGGIPSRDDPSPVIVRAPSGARRSNTNQASSSRSVKIKKQRAASISSLSSGLNFEPVRNKKTKDVYRLKKEEDEQTVTNALTGKGGDVSSDLSAAEEDDDELRNSDDLSSESDDPDDRAFRPSSVARPRKGAAAAKTPAAAASHLVPPAPEVDRTTRSAHANVSSNPRNFFKRGPLPPQAGPLINKRPRGGNPIEFFRRRGEPERDIVTENGSSAAELEDLRILGIHVQLPPPTALTLRLPSGNVSSASDSQGVDLGERRAKDGTRRGLYKRKNRTSAPVAAALAPRASLLLKRTSLRNPSPLVDTTTTSVLNASSAPSASSSSSTPAAVPPSMIALAGPPPGLATSVPMMDPSAMFHLGQALSFQKQAILAVVLPLILDDVFGQQNISIRPRDLQEELSKSTAFDHALEMRAKQIVIRGLHMLDSTGLAASGAPLASPSLLLSGASRRLSSVVQSPQMDKDLKFLSDMAVIHLVHKILSPVLSAISRVCASSGIALDEPAFAAEVQAREDGAIFAAAQREARRQLARNLLEENMDVDSDV